MWKIAKREFKENVKRPGYIFITLAYPFFLAIMIILPSILLTQVHETTKIGVVDHTGELGAYFNKSFSHLIFINISLEEANQLILTQKIKGYIEIYNLSKAIYFTKSQNPSEFFIMTQYLNDLSLKERLINAGVDKSKIASIIDFSFDYSVISQKGSSKKGSYLSFMIAYMLPILFIFPLFLTGQYLVQSVAEEKEHRLIEMLLSTPISTDRLLFEKVIGLCSLGLFQVFIWSTGAFILFSRSNMSVEITLTQIAMAVIFFILGYFFYGLVLAGLGATGTNLKESQYIAMMANWLAIIPIISIGAIQNNISFARKLAIFPFFTPTTMMIRIFSIPPGFVECSVFALLMVVYIFVAKKIFGKIFHLSILMYGKKPNLKEIYHFVVK